MPVDDKIIDILMQGNGWEILRNIQGRCYTTTQKQQFEEIKESFISALVSLLYGLLNYPQRLLISPQKSICIKYLSSKSHKTFGLYIQAMGLESNYLGEGPKLLTTDDYRSVVEQLQVEADDIKKVIAAISLNFGELIIRTAGQDEQKEATS